MERRYSDMRHVVETLTNVADEADIGEEYGISVHETDVVIDDLDRDDIKERNIADHLGRELCRINYNGARYTLNFHESVIHDDVVIGLTGQSSDPADVAPDLAPILDEIDAELGIVGCDLASAEAQSIGMDGHPADWEFEYDLLLSHL